MKNNFSFFSSHLAKHTLWVTVSSLCLLLSGNLHADEIKLKEFFVNGIVTHEGSSGEGSSKVTFKYEAQLVNGSDYLLYADEVDGDNGWERDSCPYSTSNTTNPEWENNIDCKTDDNHGPKSALNLPDFSDYASSSTDDYTAQWSNDYQLTLLPGEYDAVKLNGSGGNGILTFDSNGQGNNALYQINTLNLPNSTVNFGPGYYWIENLSINSGVTVNFNLEADERVVLIVKNSFTIYNDLNTKGDANQLVIINYDDLTLNSNKTVNGFLYADDTLTLNSASTVNGAVAGQKVILNSSSKVNFINLDTLPEPVIDYHFDKLNSSAEFADYSDNSLNGTPIGDTTTSINAGQVCKAATFDGDGDYINTSGIDDYLSTTASLSFWTKSSQTGSSTAWDAPGITGIEENGGGDDIFWGYIDKNNHIQIKKGNGNSVGSTTNINDGQWHHIVLTRDSSTGTVQVFVNGQLEKSNTSTTGDISNSFSSIGRIEDTRTTTSSDYSEYFNGQIDELLIFDSVLSASNIETIYSNQNAGNNYDGSERVCPTEEEVNHYEIIHDDSGLTCAEEPITIKACADSSCSDFDSSKNTTVTLQVNDGDSQTVTITDGVSSGVTISYTDTENPAVLSLKSSSYQCLSSTSKTSCEIDFSSAGFIFSSESATNTDIANQIAASPFTIYLRAVEDDDGSDDSSVDGVCTALFSDTQTISLSKTNIAPTDSSDLDFTIDEASDPITDTYSDVALEFDDNGEATLTNATYFDAGQIQLNATYTTSENVTLTGNSNSFWVRPSYLTVSAKKSDGSDINSTSTSVGDPTHKAGENFTLTVEAYNSNDVLTPNYSPGEMQLMLTRTAPLDSVGGVDGSLTYADNDPLTSAISANFSPITLSRFSAGVSTYSAAHYSEVGLLNLDIQDSDYGSEGIVIEAADIDIGRFTPAYFEITDSTDGSLSDRGQSSDTSFVYSGQMISTDLTETTGQIIYKTAPTFTITARASGGATTQNYTGDFMKLEAEYDSDTDHGILQLAQSSDASQNGADDATKVTLSATLNTPTLSAVNGEILSTFSSTDNFVYSHNENALIAPFNPIINLQISSITDEDGITANDANGAEDGILILQAATTEMEVRFGRQYMKNVYGSETTDLRVPMAVQYWNGSGFTTNTDDSFTTFNDTDEGTGCSLSYGSLASGTTSLSGNGTFANGETQSLTLAAPSDSSTGSVTVNCSVPSWLQYDWNENNGSYDDDPSAEATFGLYRGNDRVIYRGEVFE